MTSLDFRFSSYGSFFNSPAVSYQRLSIRSFGRRVTGLKMLCVLGNSIVLNYLPYPNFLSIFRGFSCSMNSHLFVLIMSQATILQSCRDGSSCVYPVRSRIKCHAQASVETQTHEPPCSLTCSIMILFPSMISM